MIDTMPQAAAIEHAIAVLRESAKQHRAAGDTAHGRSCDSAANTLDKTLTDADRRIASQYYAELMQSIIP